MFKKIVAYLGVIAVLVGMVLLFGSAKLESSPLPRTVLSEIGAICIGVGLIHLVYEHLARDEHLKFVRENIETAVRNELNYARNISTLGIRDALEQLAGQHLGDLLKNSTTAIWVLKTWFPEEGEVLEGLRHAVTKGREVHLFLCDPRSQLLAIRSRGAMWYLQQAALRIHQAVELLYIESTSKPTKVKVTLYDAWPGVPLIYFNNRIYVGFYLRGKPSPEWPWLVVDPESSFGEKLLGQFASIGGRGYGENEPRTLASVDDANRWRVEVTPWWTKQFSAPPPWAKSEQAGPRPDH